MSITEVKGREGWYDVVVYDRVSVPGQKPAKISKRVKGQKAAERAERDLKTERDRGSLTARRQTLSAYSDRWLKSRRAEISRQTAAGYGRIVSEYIDRHEIGKLRVGDIDVTAVSTFYAAVLERGSVGAPVSPETVRGVHRVLSMILKRATHDGLLRMNPCQQAKPPKDDRTEDEAQEPGVDPETAREFVTGAAGTSIGAVAAVALGTGLRRSELLALRWRDVDFVAGELHVTGKIEQVKGSVARTATKTKRSRRTVPFGANVAAVLQAQKRSLAEKRLATPAELWHEEGWVFPSLRVSFNRAGDVFPGGRIWTPNALAQEWRREIDRANGRRLGEFVAAGGAVEDFEPWEFGIHALRHAYATKQLADGVRVEIVSRRLGHSSSLVTLRVYSHVLDTERRDGVDAADGLLGALLPAGVGRGTNGTVR